jgi:hypothetical protein
VSAEQMAARVELQLRYEALPAIQTPVMRWRKLIAQLEPLPQDRGVVSVPCFRLVAQMLCGYANRNGGSCYPTVAMLAEASGYGERQTQRALAALERRGIVERDTRGGRGRATQYRLWIPTSERVTVKGDSDAERVTALSVKGDRPVTPGPSGRSVKNGEVIDEQELDPLLAARIERAQRAAFGQLTIDKEENDVQPEPRVGAG